ncbi:hypothetical protein [Mucilaginibacter agri]|uniref:Uncharacterized protein n=1 Tax=Mucilaginibacter agri TaxID=2695265 RepID=A0A965ZMT8_9SPHI|nr:hypothetical protein [Mucilaginibacter agri]NCD72471.1 hypothetical protein [Mucilaginibacter agri]
MSKYPESMPHGEISEVLPDVFFVAGTMRNEFFGSMWQFSRNMTIVRENGNLTILNSVRLNDEGLAALDSLGKVVNVVRLGDMHGMDDPFYVDRYNATFWALPGMKTQEGLKVNKELIEGGEMPFDGCTLFEFKTVKRPECILRLDRDGGILIACDSLQNWVEPDEFFEDETIAKMQGMDFFKTANLGPAWMHESQPLASDFLRLKDVAFEHALCGHGYPLINNAQTQFHKTFNDIFNI